MINFFVSFLRILLFQWKTIFILVIDKPPITRCQCNAGMCWNWTWCRHRLGLSSQGHCQLSPDNIHNNRFIIPAMARIYWVDSNMSINMKTTKAIKIRIKTSLWIQIVKTINIWIKCHYLGDISGWFASWLCHV